MWIITSFYYPIYNKNCMLLPIELVQIRVPK